MLVAGFSAPFLVAEQLRRLNRSWAVRLGRDDLPAQHRVRYRIAQLWAIAQGALMLLASVEFLALLGRYYGVVSWPAPVVEILSEAVCRLAR